VVMMMMMKIPVVSIAFGRKVWMIVLMLMMSLLLVVGWMLLM
jgi:hypothetical protein